MFSLILETFTILKKPQIKKRKQLDENDDRRGNDNNRNQHTLYMEIFCRDRNI